MDASYRAVLLICLFLLIPPVAAGESRARAAPAITQEVLDQQVQQLLEQSLDLEKELRIAEEELVPVRQRLEIIVALNAHAGFRLRTLELTLDGKPLARHSYSPVELAALREGAAQRLYVGNPEKGSHRLTVHYAGSGGAGASGSATLVFTTGTAAQLIEIALNDYAYPEPEGDEPRTPAVEMRMSNWVLPP